MTGPSRPPCLLASSERAQRVEEMSRKVAGAERNTTVCCGLSKRCESPTPRRGRARDICSHCRRRREQQWSVTGCHAIVTHVSQPIIPRASRHQFIMSTSKAKAKTQQLSDQGTLNVSFFFSHCLIMHTRQKYNKHILASKTTCRHWLARSVNLSKKLRSMRGHFGY